MWNKYISTTNIDETLNVLADYKENARIVAGATDLILELERGQRKGIDALIDITRIPGMDRISLDEDNNIHLGPLVTHNHCAGSRLIQDYALPLAMAAWEVGSPQIRNRGTIVGNLVTASPANDTISPLVALNARLILRSKTGERVVELKDFYTGVRKTVLKSDEMVVDIVFPAMTRYQKGTYMKVALRKAQAISLLNISVILTLADKKIEKASIALGAVAPTIIHADAAESYLAGKELGEEILDEAAGLVLQAARPISDVRGSASYRKAMVRVGAKRCLKRFLTNTERGNLPESPVLLMGEKYKNSTINEMITHDHAHPIVTTINGKKLEFEFGQNKSLLRFLREEGLMTGTKEGCAEGECGACTVYLDGAAVMACMVPAPRAHGATIITIEGLAPDGKLSPVQHSFVEEGAVQCGYCTPGFVMSATKLLEEKTNPSKDEIVQAITGNLCRCTGYYKIVEAIEKAAKMH